MRVDASRVGGKLLVEYLEDVTTAVRMFAPDGTGLGAVELPGLGSGGGFDGDADDSETLHSFSSFNVPNTIYRFNAATGQSTIFKAPVTPFDPADYTVTPLFYTTKDGTCIPLFLVHRGDLILASGAPTLLYGFCLPRRCPASA